MVTLPYFDIAKIRWYGTMVLVLYHTGTYGMYLYHTIALWREIFFPGWVCVMVSALCAFHAAIFLKIEIKETEGNCRPSGAASSPSGDIAFSHSCAARKEARRSNQRTKTKALRPRLSAAPVNVVCVPELSIHCRAYW